MPKRERSSDSTNDGGDTKMSSPHSPKKMKVATPDSKASKKTPQKNKAKTPQLKTPNMHKSKQTPKSQKVTMKSPKTTPKGNGTTPKVKKGTPYPKKRGNEDESNGTEEDLKVPKKKKNNRRNKKEKSETQAKKTTMNGKAKKEDTDERDAKSLFIKNFPPNYTSSQVKALSPDILKVALKARGSKNLIRYGFLRFESPAMAKLNYDKLKGTKIGGQEIHVDLVRRDLPAKPVIETPDVVKYDKKRLFVVGLLGEVTEKDMRTLFPKMKKVVLSRKHAFVNFDTEEDCKNAAKDTMQNATLKGNKLTVTYAKKKTRAQRAKKTKKDKLADKKLKKKQEEEDDEDDDEEEDDEEDMEFEDDEDDDDDDDDE